MIEFGRHGVSDSTKPITTTVSSAFVLSQPWSGALDQASDRPFHAVQAASSPSGSSAGERRSVPGGRAIARTSSSAAASRAPG